MAGLMASQRPRLFPPPAPGGRGPAGGGGRSGSNDRVQGRCGRRSPLGV